MAPEEDVINASSLTKFRKLRLKDLNLLDMLINKTVLIALEKGIIKSKSIIVDATYTQARYNPKKPCELLRDKSKLLRKAVYQIDETVKDSFPNKNTEDDLEKEISYSKELETLYHKSKATGMEIENMIGDAAYSEKGNIELAETEGVNLVLIKPDVIKKELKVKRIQCRLKVISIKSKWNFKKVNILKKKQKNAIKLRRRIVNLNIDTVMMLHHHRV